MAHGFCILVRDKKKCKIFPEYDICGSHIISLSFKIESPKALDVFKVFCQLLVDGYIMCMIQRNSALPVDQTTT